MAEEAVQILPEVQPEEEEQEDFGLNVGDTVLILGGKYNKTRGKLYGFRQDRFTILPLGSSNNVIHIPLIDGAPDEEYGIKEIKVLKQAAKPGFVFLVDMRPGQYVETFDTEGKEAGVFEVIEVDEEDDTALLRTESGDEFRLEFNFEGIPVGSPYEVIRTREPPEEKGNSETKEGEEDEEENRALKGVEERDILEEGQSPSLTQEKEENQEAVSFEVGEEVELPVEEEIKEISSSERIYSDEYQRSEMLSQIIRSLPLLDQRNPIKLQKIRREIELFMILRNELVKYGVTGRPLGMKLTSKPTLIDLLSKNEKAKLIRKVVQLEKVLCIDHSKEHLNKYSSVVKTAYDQFTFDKLKKGDDPSPGKMDEEGLRFDYLSDIVKKAEKLEELMASTLGKGSDESQGMPEFFKQMENYRKQIHTPYITNGEPVKEDEEVFRMEVPNLEDPEVYGYKSRGFEQLMPETTEYPYSLLRTVSGRKGRFSKEERNEFVEAPDKLTSTNLLVFPLSTQRDIGPIRTGNLAKDVSMGMTSPRTMDMILEDLDEITDFPTSDGILNIGVNGILGNISVKDWLNTLDLKLDGKGDVYELLNGYGLLNNEFNKEESEIIQGKIEEHAATLKNFLIKQREENATKLSNLRYTPNPLLPNEQSVRLLSRLEGEPLLQQVIGEIKEFMGDLAESDLVWFSYVFLKYPDLCLAILGKQEGSIAKERIRHVRNQYIERIRNAYLVREQKKNAGEPPKVNRCPHVKSLENVRKIGQAYGEESKDTLTMKALLAFLNKFRGEIKEEWVWCNVCNEHLICAHEFLQIQEFLRPKEQETLHKEMLIKYSGGSFSGQYICKVCGQKISDFEFDSSMEFDDEGRPMMGRSVMVDEDAIRQKALEDLVSAGPAKEEEEEEDMEMGSEKTQEIYRVFKTICGLLGINPEKEDYKNMVSKLSSYLNGLPTREKYMFDAEQRKQQRVQDYDIWYSIRYVTAAAAITLINIQTRVPDYIIYYTSADCKNGFYGYPIESEDNLTGLTCITTIVAGINENTFPWNATTIQRGTDLIKRRDAILNIVKGQVKMFSEEPVTQLALKKKREYRIKTFGEVGDSKSEQIPETFRPIPYVLTEEEAAEGIVVPESASEENKAVAWIRTAHGIARQNSALNPDAPLSETTCCLHEVGKPYEFWASFGKTLPELEPRKLERPPYRSVTLAPTFYTEKQAALKGKVEASEYYKLYSKFCYEGDNKGLPHEIGLSLTCLQCGLTFKRNPNLPYNTEASSGKGKEEEIKKLIAEDKAYLEGQGIIMNEENYNDLLNTVHRKAEFNIDKLPIMPRKENTFTKLANLEIQPVDNFPTLLQKIQTVMIELGPLATKRQVIEASQELMEVILEKEDAIKLRLGNNVFKAIESLVRRNPRECGESITTFLLTPFRRWMSGIKGNEYRMLSTYELDPETINSIMVKGLGSHLDSISDKFDMKGLILRKVRYFVKELSLYCKEVFPNLRSVLVPGGQTMIEILLRAFVMGAIEKFINPGVIPEGDEEIVGEQNIKGMYEALKKALTKYVNGSYVPSDEEIRLALEQRAEKERQKFVKRLDGMTKEGRQVELQLKKLGMGEWAIGGSKAIREYDPERQEAERVERVQAGIVDYPEYERHGGKSYDMFGAVSAADGDGFDVDQMREDDY